MKGYFSNSSIINNIIDGNTHPKINHLNDVASPINSPLGEAMLMRYLPSGLLSDSDQLSSPNQSCPIVKYRYYNKNRSPLSAMENLERSPAVVKVEDEVLVMDGILVTPKSGGKFRSPTSSDSGGNSSDTGSGSLYKTELCLTWEDTGACRYGHKCQFAHGQEELRPPANRIQHPRPMVQHGQEELRPPANRFQTPRPMFPHGQGELHPPGFGFQQPGPMFAHGQGELRPPGFGFQHPGPMFAHGQGELGPPGFGFQHPDMPMLMPTHPYFSRPPYFTPGNRFPNVPYSPEEPMGMAGFFPGNVVSNVIYRPEEPLRVPVVIRHPRDPSHQINKAPSVQWKSSLPVSASTVMFPDWSPVDDGIEVGLPDEPSSRDYINTYVSDILYGHQNKKRLTVFSDLCPE